MGFLAAFIFMGWNTSNEQCKAAGFDGAEGWSDCRVDDNYGFSKIGMVVGNTSNVPAPGLTDEVKRYLRNSLAMDAKYTIVSATPGMGRVTAAKVTVKDGTDISSFVGGIDKRVTAVAEVLVSAPTADGAQYLEAVRYMSKSVMKDEKPLVVVIGSGLSDGGLLDFAGNDLLHKDAQQIFERLVETREITAGEMSGVTVVWSGLGRVAHPQEQLGGAESANLRQLYTLMLEYMGATVEFDDSLPETEPEFEVSKTVAVTPIQKVDIDICNISMDESYARFRVESAELINHTETVAKIQQTGCIEELKKSNNNYRLTLVGYQAVCAASKDLSVARATTIKNIFISFGIPAEKISVDGVAGPPDNRTENPRCGSTGVATEHRTVMVKVER